MDYKEIPSFPRYKISKEGEVISKNNRILAKKGKLKNQVHLRNGKVFTVAIKRLLAETWFIDDWMNQLDPDEDWKEIDGYNDYIITSKGKVWSKKSLIWLQPCASHLYYWAVNLSKNGKATGYNIHMLVGRHFLPDYKEGLDILHYDEELSYPQINYVGNLWCGTNDDNIRDKVKKGRQGKTNKTGYRCVGRTSGANTFYFITKHNGKSIYKGGFATPLEAHEAYLAKRMEIKGY